MPINLNTKTEKNRILYLQLDSMLSSSREGSDTQIEKVR